jgi:tRNA threonylcarbamoyladenosine biosynthesis protein TsaE
MTLPATLTLDLASEAETHQLAAHLAKLAAPGVTVLLDGPVGAGKTTLARHVILALLAQHDQVEDVPSPTFTIVQTYEAGPLEIWHADLYRLTSTNELNELGLDAAFDTAFCLVEWPDRMGTHRPDALSIALSYGKAEAERTAELSATGTAQTVLDRLIEGLPQ